jgi:ABC-type multidrug transport system fused ATPase/permease subunit
MFFILLLVTLAVSLLTSALCARFFDRAVDRVLTRIVGEDLADAWHKYIVFAVMVVGVSGGVQLFELQKYIANTGDNGAPPPLTYMSWTLEVYRTVLESLQSIAWMLLLFFLCGMVALVVMRALEQRSKRPTE